MSKVTIGLVLSMLSIYLMNKNLPFIGLPLFILGIFLMMHKKKHK